LFADAMEFDETTQRVTLRGRVRAHLRPGELRATAR
jgi:hypothetical protein